MYAEFLIGLAPGHWGTQATPPWQGMDYEVVAKYKMIRKSSGITQSKLPGVNRFSKNLQTKKQNKWQIILMIFCLLAWLHITS